MLSTRCFRSHMKFHEAQLESVNIELLGGQGYHNVPGGAFEPSHQEVLIKKEVYIIISVKERFL